MVVGTEKLELYFSMVLFTRPSEVVVIIEYG